MEKLLFLVPDVDTAKGVVTTLRQHGLEDEDIGVLANSETRVESLPEADVEDDSDVLPAFARGVAAGGATGLVAGLAALAFPGLGLVAAGAGAAMVATTTLGGASFGAFTSALIGTSVDNSQLQEYEEAIERGELLIVADVKEDERRMNEIKKALSEAYPSLSLEGKKGTPPAV